MLFADFNDDARLWIYGFSKPLTASDQKNIRMNMNDFMASWTSHGDKVKGAYHIIYDRFIIIVAENTISGCSIDSSIKVLQQLDENYNLNGLDFSLVFYRNKGNVFAVSRRQFQKLVQNGTVDHHTIVYNNTLTTLGQLRAGEWETTFDKSWHAKTFKKSA
ncbi:MAG: hypothetical protein GF313_01035 [Caldithrix sp.]|nr:hypothetical protein [Caldithrix sp.]